MYDGKKGIILTNKKDLVCRVRDSLNAEKIRKEVHIPKRRFYITDDAGNQAVFHVKETEKTVGYGSEDVTVIIEAFLNEVLKAIASGERVCLHGFGIFEPKLRKGKKGLSNLRGEPFETEDHWVPKFTPGKPMKTAAAIYGNTLKALGDPL